MVGAPAQTVEVALLEAAVAGARSWLAEHGVSLGEGYPRLWIEVFEVEERSAGVVLVGGEPRAQGVRLEATGRAFLERAPGEPAGETGALRVTEGIEPVGGRGWRELALRGLGWKLGEALAKWVWGEGDSLLGRMW